VQGNNASTLTATTVNLDAANGPIGGATVNKRIRIDATNMSAQASADAYASAAVDTGADGLTNNSDSDATAGIFEASILTAGDLTISADVSATTIQLYAQGNGDIVQGGATDILTATTVNLDSDTGNIGTSVNEIQTNADNLSAQTSGDVYIDNDGSVTLNAS